jgi:TrmH RNA methyltransferase
MFRDLCRELAERKRPYKLCDDEELLRICKTPHHQGVAAMIEDAAVEPLSRDDLGVWSDERRTGVVLHAVGNDFNAGAIVRAAAFFDASMVVISETETDVRLSTAAYRVAEGGMEHVAVRSVRKTAAFLREAASRLFVIGTDPRARLQVADLPALLREREREPGGIALVLGNEERGLPPEVKRHCTALLRIPGTGNIESLNVAQSAAVFLHAIYEA